MVSAGCAIGIGNIWKFPYMAGENGGGVFVLFYLLFLVIMGIPVMTMEYAIGRASRQSLMKGYKKLEKPGSKWHIHGWFAIMGSYLLMMYYTTVSGWILDYFCKFMTGTFDRLETDAVGEVFMDMLANPTEMTIFMAVIVISGFAVLNFGLNNGLERINKFMMVGLFLIIIVLVIKSLTLEGAAEAMKFYLFPDFERASGIGMERVIFASMKQAFFTLSIGIGCIEVFGSYMSEEKTLTGEAVKVCILDTLVAVMAGMIIFPACFSYNIKADQGPSLIFITLPTVFMNMPGGRVWGTLFFILMTFASFSTVTAVFENLVAFMMDDLGMSRRKSVFINMIIILVMSMPCVLGYNVLGDLRIMGDKNVLDFEDFIVSSILLPVGSLIITLFCVSESGWGMDNYIKEVNSGEGIKISTGLERCIQFALPVLILIVLIEGLV